MTDGQRNRERDRIRGGERKTNRQSEKDRTGGGKNKTGKQRENRLGKVTRRNKERKG